MTILEQDLLFEENEALAPYTSFKIGGPARYFAKLHTCEDFKKALLFCSRRHLPYIVLGKGSNTLFDQRGFPGVVLLNKMENIEIREDGYCVVDSGVSFPLLSVRTAKLGWAGLEFAAGIPCSVGGALFMNAGANGMSSSEPLLWVRYIDTSANIITFERDELFFSYRYSSFQEMKGLILQAAFLLNEDAEARDRQQQMLQKRKATQPCGDCSAGCIFRNPVGLSAGKLIEDCGLKGVRVGGAEISQKHANFIVNVGSASSEDVLQLVAMVKHVVKLEMGVDLQEEVRYVPFNRCES